MNKLPTVTKDTLSDKAYKIIKEAIISNNYKPGDVLVEEALAEQLNISRTPIRDALKRLLYEHIIVQEDNKKLVVSTISLDDIRDVTVVRSSLEELAVQLLEGKMDKSKKKTLQKLADKCASIVENGIEGNEVDYLEADYNFHMFIAECSGNSYLIDMIEKVSFVTKRFHTLSGTLDRYSQTATEEHSRVVSAILEDNYEEASKAMHSHICLVGERMPIK